MFLTTKKCPRATQRPHKKIKKKNFPKQMIYFILLYQTKSKLRKTTKKRRETRMQIYTLLYIK